MPDRICGPKIDDHLELGGLLDRQLSVLTRSLTHLEGTLTVVLSSIC